MFTALNMIEFYGTILILLSFLISIIILLLNNRYKVWEFLKDNKIIIIFLMILYISLQVFTRQYFRFYQDETDSIEAARNIISRGFPVGCSLDLSNSEICEPFYKMLGFPAIQSLFFRIFGYSTDIAIRISEIFAILTVISIFILVYFASGKKAAVISASLVALLPVFNEWSATSLDMTAFIFFAITTIILFIEYSRKRDATSLLLFFISASSCSVIRIEGVVLFALILFDIRGVLDTIRKMNRNDKIITAIVSLAILSILFIAASRYISPFLREYAYSATFIIIKPLSIILIASISLIILIASHIIKVDKIHKKIMRILKNEKRTGENIIYFSFILYSIFSAIVMISSFSSFRPERKLMIAIVLGISILGMLLYKVKVIWARNLAIAMFAALSILMIFNMNYSETLYSQKIMMDEMKGIGLDRSCYLISGIPSIWNSIYGSRTINIEDIYSSNVSVKKCYYLMNDISSLSYAHIATYGFIKSISEGKREKVYSLESLDRGMKKDFELSVEKINSEDVPIIDIRKYYILKAFFKDDKLYIYMDYFRNSSFSIGRDIQHCNYASFGYRDNDGIVSTIGLEKKDEKCIFSLNDKHNEMMYSINILNVSNRNDSTLELLPEDIFPHSDDSNKYFIQFNTPVSNSIKGISNRFLFTKEELFNSVFTVGKDRNNINYFIIENRVKNDAKD